VDHDRPADRGGRHAGGRKAAVHLDRLDLPERQVGQVDATAEGVIERHPVEIDHHLLGARATDRHGRELAAQALHLHADRLAQQLGHRRDAVGEILRADHGGERRRIEGRRTLGGAAYLDRLDRPLRHGRRLGLRRRIVRRPRAGGVEDKRQHENGAPGH